MRKFSVLIGICALVGLALTVVGQEQEVTQALSPVMKDVGATLQSLRRNLDAKSAADVAKDAEKLQTLFTQAQGKQSGRRG